MNHLLPYLAATLLLLNTTSHAAELSLSAPLDFQVVQRSSPGKGLLRIAGELAEEPAATDLTIEAQLTDDKRQTPWLRVGGSVSGRTLTGTVEAPAGGWWKLTVRVVRGSQEFAHGEVPHVGIGEVFVVAGQSNSANYGEEKQTPASGRAASFDGVKWQIAHDPQPGAGGKGGSFMPPFADAVVAKENVPVGIVACGIGATSVREWLPKGATFPNPPTIESRVQRLPDGRWMSRGDAYAMLVARMKSLGAGGFRAVLWHQGESDANQKDSTRTLPRELYREYLEKIIRDSRREIGWDAPWFVAQASYHVPGDEGSEDIRAAQAALWQDGIALEGPDSDALKASFRERGGAGVHFSGPGLREHGSQWAAKVLPWLEHQWTEPRKTDSGTEWTDYARLPECHSLGWVAANVQTRDTKSWDGVLDEAKWGVPSPQQIVARNWDWKVRTEQWRETVKQKGEGPREEVRFDLWLPDEVTAIRGIVVISGHGSGEQLFKRKDLRAIAAELDLALFKFVGNPLQRGFWPQSLLLERLQAFGEKCGRPELEHAPLFLYGHSNGTGFSAVFPAYLPQRVWGWVSMRPGTTFQVYQPAAAQVPGLVVFGEDDPFLARPSREENLAVVPTLRKRHGAIWNVAVEPKTGHGPGENTWPLVFSFLRHTLAARVPANADARQGPVKLRTLAVETGYLGRNWDSVQGGYQTLSVAPFASFRGDQSTASWLINAAYAADWQAFQREGRIKTTAPPRDDAAWLRENATLVFADSFDREEDGNGLKAIGNGWESATADRAPHVKQADLDDGVLKIASDGRTAGHGVHIHHDAGFADGGTMLRFRFPGLNRGETLTVGHVDRELKGVHAGHLCYANLYPTSILLRDNKTGVSELSIRARRQPYVERREALPADLDALLQTKEKTVPWRSDNRWHELTLVFEGDEMRLTIDGRLVATHRSEGFAHPMKRWLSFSASNTVWIDEVRIWKVK